MKSKHKLHSFLLGIAFAALLVVFDQFTKYLAVTNLKDQNPLVLIPGVFELRYLENRGAAFGILQGQKTLLLIGTGLILLFVLWAYYNLPTDTRFHIIRWIMIGITAGAVGNMIDRAANQFVVDFFYFSLIDFPIFNVADIYVVVAAIGLVVSFLFYYKEEDMDAMLPWRNSND